MKLKLRNVGPHQSLCLDFNSKVSVLFTENGKGKSFVGKSFQAIDNYFNEDFMKALVTLGEKDASIEVRNEQEKIILSFTKSGNTVKKGAMSTPIHVFNEKFIEENLKVYGFKPNRSIEGIILGKGNIDLLAERRRLVELQTDIIDIQDKLSNIVDTSKMELKNYDITHSLNAFKSINFDTIFSMNGTPRPSNKFNEYTAEYIAIRNTPDISVDVPYLKMNINYSAFKTLNDLIKFSFNRSHFDEEFKKEFKRKRDFIIFGLKEESSSCPYCKQEYSANAIKLIDNYNRFLDDNENKIVTELGRLLQMVDLTSNDLRVLENVTYKKVNEQYQLVTLALAKSKRNKLMPISSTSYICRLLSRLTEIIKLKINDISFESSVCEQLIDEIIDELNTLSDEVKQINNQISTLNSLANNNSKEKLRLKREICESYKEVLYSQLYSDIDHLKKLQMEMIDLKDSVQNKEKLSKVSKKVLVYETFECLINQYFNGKFNFDPSSCSLVFYGAQLDSQAKNVLSEGEKTVVAFLYFISSIHSVVNHISDYSKVIVVIDDPTTNLDSSNIMKISVILSDIGSKIKVDSDIKTIILTHNNQLLDHMITNTQIRLLNFRSVD